MNPEELFNKIQEKYGFDLAVVFCEKILPQEFWGHLDFSQLLAIGQRMVRATVLEITILDNMIRVAERTDQLLAAWGLACKANCSHRQSVILRKLENTEVSLDDWFEVFDAAPEGSEPQLIALKKIQIIIDKAALKTE